MNFTYQEISEHLPLELRTVPERLIYEGIPLPEGVRQFYEDGYLVIKNAVPDELIDRYCRVREKVDIAQGYGIGTPYLHVPEIRDLGCTHLIALMMQWIMNEPVGMHLNLTGWKSTERDWHSDSYLNPPFIGSNYIAAWFALDRIHPDSGPFEFIPGSHRWPVIRREKLFELIPKAWQTNPDWPWLTQGAVAKACQDEIDRVKAGSAHFLGERGDVLLWHSGLIHRGSKPRDPSLVRKSLICHYSTLSKRTDMPNYRPHGSGWYFEL